MEIIYKDWVEEAEKRFGPEQKNWRFICPSCGHEASAKDWIDAGAKESEIAFSCIGRHSPDHKKTAEAAFKKKGGPCNYTGGGLIGLNPVCIVTEDGSKMNVFDFASEIPF